MIKAVPHIATMSPYALAELKAPSGKRFISLSQNESLRPPSPMAVDAAAKALHNGHLYPDPDWCDLRSNLSALHRIPAEQILCGNGSMELIACLTLAFAEEGSGVLAPAHAYPFFRTAARLARARFDTAPETTAGVSVDAMLDALRPDTRLVFIANPGNPTGTRIPRDELLRLREGLPDHVLLVIDEAYGEFADHLGEQMFDLVGRGDTVILRTFSKAYGLAGLRIGWGLVPSAIGAEIRKVMNPNNISAAAQAAAAAAVCDEDHMQETCMMTAQSRDGFITRLRDAGFIVSESFTNFALVRFDSAETAHAIDAWLRSDGVIARPQGGAGLPDSLRITVGTADELDRAAGLMERWAQREVT
jgi:histidinol-phosphate aminotransferase